MKRENRTGLILLLLLVFVILSPAVYGVPRRVLNELALVVPTHVGVNRVPCVYVSIDRTGCCHIRQASLMSHSVLPSGQEQCKIWNCIIGRD